MAAGRQTVTTRPPNLLDVGLKGLRHVVVNDGPNVRLVDAHAEGYRGHHHPQLARHEVTLHSSPSAGCHARMIGLSRGTHPDAPLPSLRQQIVALLQMGSNQFGQPLALVASCAVHNDTVAFSERAAFYQHGEERPITFSVPRGCQR